MYLMEKKTDKELTEEKSFTRRTDSSKEGAAKSCRAND